MRISHLFKTISCLTSLFSLFNFGVVAQVKPSLIHQTSGILEDLGANYQDYWQGKADYFGSLFPDAPSGIHHLQNRARLFINEQAEFVYLPYPGEIDLGNKLVYSSHQDKRYFLKQLQFKTYIHHAALTYFLSKDPEVGQGVRQSLLKQMRHAQFQFNDVSRFNSYPNSEKWRKGFHQMLGWSVYIEKLLQAYDWTWDLYSTEERVVIEHNLWWMADYLLQRLVSPFLDSYLKNPGAWKTRVIRDEDWGGDNYSYGPTDDRPKAFVCKNQNYIWWDARLYAISSAYAILLILDKRSSLVYSDIQDTNARPVYPSSISFKNALSERLNWCENFYKNVIAHGIFPDQLSAYMTRYEEKKLSQDGEVLGLGYVSNHISQLVDMAWRAWKLKREINLFEYQDLGSSGVLNSGDEKTNKSLLSLINRYYEIKSQQISDPTYFPKPYLTAGYPGRGSSDGYTINGIGTANSKKEDDLRQIGNDALWAGKLRHYLQDSSHLVLLQRMQALIMRTHPNALSWQDTGFYRVEAPHDGKPGAFLDGCYGKAAAPDRFILNP